MRRIVFLVLRGLALLAFSSTLVLVGAAALRPVPPQAAEAPQPAGVPASPTVAAPSPSHSARPSPRLPSGECGPARARRLVRFRVEVDEGLPVTASSFANGVFSVLCDRRSWVASGTVRFRYDPEGALLIGLRTPDEAQRICLKLTGLSVLRRYSCGTPRQVVINSDRWLTGSPSWPGPLAQYRQMVVNHEVGHALGLHHQTCPKDGAPAPVMMQQSKGLVSPNGRRCAPNPWPLAADLARLR